MRSRVLLSAALLLLVCSNSLSAQVQAELQITAGSVQATTVTVVSKVDDIRSELLPGLEAFQKSFNEGKADEFANFFLPEGEFVDEQGAVHSGRAAIQEMMTGYFKDYPGMQLAITVDSLRQLGPDLLIEEGTRELFAPEVEAAVAKVRYVAVRAKRDGKWMLATVREFNEAAAPTPGQQLAPLSFLVGDWVNQGVDATLKINFRWSEDGNFLIGEFENFSNGQSQGKATQRFGWDPVNQQIRSWLFEPDGAYSDGLWSPTEKGWLCKSTSVLPDGTTGSAIVEVVVEDDDHFILKGRDRVIGGSTDGDYEVKVVRQVEKPGATTEGSGK
ncbi:MAG: SgcJ/EcaC family oxidoreductase [Planctomycetota bacterium]